jgi:putative ABC transport system permease protein
VFVYLIRSIRARRLENLAIVGVFAVVVATGTLILTFAANMQDMALNSGDPSAVVVLSKGASSLGGSSAGKGGYDWVRVLPGIEQRAGVAQVSPELMSQTQLRTTTGVSLFVAVRGVDAIAYPVHDVHVAKGRLPQPGTDEVVIGKMLDGVFPDLAVGGHWNKHPIVGVFDKGGSLIETELWVDRQRLAIELGRRVSEPVGFCYVKASSPADAGALVDRISNSKEPLSAFTEPKYLETAGGDSKDLMRMAIWFSLLLAFGAGIASVNTLYSSLLGRLPEFAMLNAIGVRRRRLAGLILQESVLLALAGIAIGLGITLALSGQQIARLWTDHPFEQLPLHVGLRSILEGVAIGLGVGIAGGLFPGFSIFRMDVRKNLA